MKISNIIDSLFGDISHSDCGRELNNIVGKCARILSSRTLCYHI